MLTAAELSFMRETAALALPDLCEVLRQDLIDDRGKLVPRDPLNPWPVIASNQSVRIDPYRLTPVNREAGGAITVEGSFNAVFAYGFDIRNKDRIRVATLNNRIFKMIGPRHGSYEIERVMACEEVT